MNTAHKTRVLPVSMFAALLLATVAVLSFSFATTDAEAGTAIRALVEQRVTAVKTADQSLFLSTLDDSDPEYLIEQRHWFFYATTSIDLTDFRMAVESISMKDSTTAVANLRVEYTIKFANSSYNTVQMRSVRWNERYVKRADGWKDSDVDFKTEMTDHFVIKYQAASSDLIPTLKNEAEKGALSVAANYGQSIAHRVTIKVYESSELLREQSDINIPFLFTGWGEHGESIRLHGYRNPARPFGPVIAHEYVHKLTLEIAPNQCSWFAEGLASCYGNNPMNGGDPIKQGQFNRTDFSHDISWLEKLDMANLPPSVTSKYYYARSAMIITFLDRVYGLEKVHEIVAYLARFPLTDDRPYDYATMEPQTQKWLHEALENVLGTNMTDLNAKWRNWIGAYAP